MDSILCQVKSAVDSASRPMGIYFFSYQYIESLLQKKIPSENRKEKKCIVSPDIEVAILHNANLDLEVVYGRIRLLVDFIETEEGGSKEATTYCR